MTAFEDHFSRDARTYAAHRPRYPEALFDWLADAAPGRRLAWDCATGNGQAALALARRFEQVEATDASAAQIAHTVAAPNVRYRVALAEEPPLTDGSVDLVTVAQALHWFDHDRFFAAVRRVVAPGGLFAAWAYELFRVDPEVDAAIDAWYRGPLGPHWPAGRRHIESGYRTIPFPLDEVAAPAFAMTAVWTLEQVLGYLATWSAVGRYGDATGADALALVREPLARAWGPADATRAITWPLSLRVGR